MSLASSAAITAPGVPRPSGCTSGLAMSRAASITSAPQWATCAIEGSGDAGVPAISSSRCDSRFSAPLPARRP